MMSYFFLVFFLVFLTNAFLSDVLFSSDIFQINTLTTFEDQKNPDIASFSNGNFVIVWESIILTDWNILGRIFDENGENIKEFLVTEFTGSINTNPSVTSLNNDKFVVVWDRYMSQPHQEDLIGRIFNVDDIDLYDSDEYILNLYDTDRQILATVLTIPDNRIMIVYQSKEQDGDGYGIYANIFFYNLTSTLYNYEEIRINYFDIGSQYEAAPILLTNGHVAIAMKSDLHDSTNIIYRYFDTEYDMLYPNYDYLSTIPGGNIGTFTVSPLNDRRFALIYSNTSTDYDIFIKIISVTDYEPGELKLEKVNDGSDSTQRLMSSVTLSNGKLLVLWEEDTLIDGEYNIIGQLYSSLGARDGDNVFLITNSSDRKPVVEALDSGKFVVTWIDNSINVYGQIFSTEPTVPLIIKIRSTFYMIAYFILFAISLFQFFRLFCCISRNVEAKWHLTVQHFLYFLVALIHISIHFRDYSSGPHTIKSMYGTFALSMDSIQYALLFGLVSITILVLANVFHNAVGKGHIAQVHTIRGPFQFFFAIIALFVIGYHAIIQSLGSGGRVIVLGVFAWCMFLLSFCIFLTMTFYCYQLLKAVELSITPDLSPKKRSDSRGKMILFYGPLFSLLLWLGSVFRVITSIDPYNIEIYRWIHSLIDLSMLIFLLLFLEQTMYASLVSHRKTRPFNRFGQILKETGCCPMFFPSHGHSRESIDQNMNFPNQGPSDIPDIFIPSKNTKEASQKYINPALMMTPRNSQAKEIKKEPEAIKRKKYSKTPSSRKTDTTRKRGSSLWGENERFLVRMGVISKSPKVKKEKEKEKLPVLPKLNSDSAAILLKDCATPTISPSTNVSTPKPVSPIQIDINPPTISKSRTKSRKKRPKSPKVPDVVVSPKIMIPSEEENEQSSSSPVESPTSKKGKASPFSILSASSKSTKSRSQLLNILSKSENNEQSRSEVLGISPESKS